MDRLIQQEAGELKHSCLHSGEAGKAVGAQQPKLETSAVSFWCWRLGALWRAAGLEFTLNAEETGVRCLTSSCSTRILPLEEWSLPMMAGFLVFYLGSQLIAHNQGRSLLFRHCHISGNAPIDILRHIFYQPQPSWYNQVNNQDWASQKPSVVLAHLLGQLIIASH